ncbi:P-loop containing nucleoside triphosphate hydrolase protein [Penicillium taxi]|uniref:P-loop containing nucleoside triphosphate hydrolase protein n=1 Tax=Penicillium taxi TaxID=168475 RepID=UPI002544F996|nr:P-loop containing nucleoside triphosphate hydrolase protein [Penicillium taxi]KAJ5902128.1 P-loop containing nucleoside triphosphate hydrolase protein [Penicillium taxi]
MDLLTVLPDFSTKSYTHILPPLERSKITTVDLITLDTLEIAKRAHVPPADVRRLSTRIIEALHTDLGFEKTSNIDSSSDEAPGPSVNRANFTLGPPTKLHAEQWDIISTLDPTMDALLGGGIPTGYVTEVTGERNKEKKATDHGLVMSSGSGKTQFLLNILMAVQLAKPDGLEKRAIYISTEHPLATSRLTQLLEYHPLLSKLPADQAPSLENILSISAMDMEAQDHILNFQLPVAIKRYNVGLVIIDSITSNYRAEHSSTNMLGILARSTELAKLGHLLRNLAATEDIAIVLANQVSDRFEPMENRNGGYQASTRLGIPTTTSPSGIARESGAVSPRPRSHTDSSRSVIQQPHNSSLPSSSPFPSSPHPTQDEQFDGSYLIANPARNETLSLLHQERFFTGWGDAPERGPSSLKTPALGVVWSTQIACRIALKKNGLRVPHPELWEGAYPMSTPTPQAQGKPSESRPGFSSAKEIQTEKPQAEGEGNDQSVPLRKPPVQPELSEPEHITRRSMKVVFSPWAAGSIAGEVDRRGEVDFEIWKGGLRCVRDE